MNDFELTVPDLYSLSKDSRSIDTCKLIAKGTDLFENSACISNGRFTKTSVHSPWGTCNLMHRILTTKHPGFCSQEICTIVQRFFIPFAVNVSTCIHYCFYSLLSVFSFTTVFRVNEVYTSFIFLIKLTWLSAQFVTTSCSGEWSI